MNAGRLAQLGQKPCHVASLLLTRDGIGLTGRDRFADDLYLVAVKFDHDPTVVVRVPFHVGCTRVILWRQACGDVADLARLPKREAGHVPVGFRVVRLTVTGQVDLRPADIAVEVTLKVEDDLLLHAGEPHPARDFAGRGVIQLAFQ